MKFDLEENVNIMISGRHVHLTEDAINKLFGHELHVRNNLNQVGQFASIETVTIETCEGVIENVRVIGPARKYIQVEMSASDARRLGLRLPVRKSGNLDGAGLIKVKTDKGEITGNFDNGIGGYLDEEYVAKHYKAAEAMYIADPGEVQTGEAYIYSRLDGNLKKYKINILAVHTDTANKNMEFKVEDEDLIALTGGVCQGMSGSPIVQNGKLIGAVTHVLVDDPTEGYAVFIENMIK